MKRIFGDKFRSRRHRASTRDNDTSSANTWLSAPVFIAHSINGAPGPALAETDQHAHYPLSLADLQLLQQLAAGGLPSPSADNKAWEILAQELDARQLLQSDKNIVPAPNSATSNVGTVATSQPDTLLLVRPFVLRLDQGGFAYLNHNGEALLALTAIELSALNVFASVASINDAFAKQQRDLGDAALDELHFRRICQQAIAAALLVDSDDRDSVDDYHKRLFAEGIRINRQRRKIIADYLEEAQQEELARAARIGVRRIKVIPVHTEPQPLLSMGLLMCYARDFDGGRLDDSYEFVRDWGNISVPKLTGDEAPAIFLFSNYLWSHTANMALSERAKEMNPRGLRIHGGPDTPKYAADVKRYLELNPHIDILVHGEGEQTLAELLDALKDKMHEGDPDLTVLNAVAGITYRIGAKMVTTGVRDRLANLDVLPSPYRNGFFDNIGVLPMAMQTIETNRGCPFGCTFCDWGSATLSKIRKFDLERVFDDLEWCAKNKVRTVFNTDANFGVFERDVEIARKVVELKEKYGYPRVFESSYAKNQVKHLKKIIDILATGGVVSTGTLSLQSVSPETLSAIKRSNIKVSKYDELAIQFSESKLPLIVEMMMGLPGSTLPSFEGDLQQAIDREVHARVNPTEVLVNSPMNDPEYRSEFAIELQRPLEDDWKGHNGGTPPDKALIVSTTSFDRAEYQQMDRWRELFLLLENFGVLRQVARYVRHETRMTEMQFYKRLDAAAHEQPHRWPTITFTLDSIRQLMVPPASWRLFIDEVHTFLVEELDVKDDAALRTVLDVQHALLPARDRTFPLQLSLAHDYGEWHGLMVRGKQAGWENDWTPAVPSLRDLKPGTFTVRDAQKLGNIGLGTPLLADQDLDWEFESPVGRALRYRRSAELT